MKKEGVRVCFKPSGCARDLAYFYGEASGAMFVSQNAPGEAFGREQGSSVRCSGGGVCPVQTLARVLQDRFVP